MLALNATQAPPELKVYDVLIRVSKLDGRKVSADTTMTVDDQRKAAHEIITANDGIVGREYMALDQSGYTVTKSDAWREALARCESGKSAGLAVAYADRLSRNWRAAGAFYDALEQANAEVLIAGMPGQDYRTPDGRLMTGIDAIIADRTWQQYKVRGDQTATELMARKVPNRVAYGYRRNGTFVNGVLTGKCDPGRDAKALVPDEERAQYVQLIFAMRAEQLRRKSTSWVAICEELERRGAPHPSPKSKRWLTATLSTMVRNRAYLGEIKLGTRREVDAHPALVTEAQWNAVQSTTPIVRNGGLVGGLATGLIYCSSCGRKMSALRGSPARPGGPPRVHYACRRYSSRGECGHPMTIGRGHVDAWLEAWVLRGIAGEEVLAPFVSARELVAAHCALEEAIGKREKVAHMVMEWEPEDVGIAMALAKDAVLKARAHYARLLEQSESATALPNDPDAWHAMTLDERRELLVLLVDRIEVLPAIDRSRFRDPTDRLVLVQAGGNG